MNATLSTYSYFPIQYYTKGRNLGMTEICAIVTKFRLSLAFFRREMKKIRKIVQILVVHIFSSSKLNFPQKAAFFGRKLFSIKSKPSIFIQYPLINFAID